MRSSQFCSTRDGVGDPSSTNFNGLLNHPSARLARQKIMQCDAAIVEIACPFWVLGPADRHARPTNWSINCHDRFGPPSNGTAGFPKGMLATPRRPAPSSGAAEMRDCLIGWHTLSVAAISCSSTHDESSGTCWSRRGKSNHRHGRGSTDRPGRIRWLCIRSPQRLVPGRHRKGRTQVLSRQYRVSSPSTSFRCMLLGQRSAISADFRDHRSIFT